MLVAHIKCECKLPSWKSHDPRVVSVAMEPCITALL